MTGLIESGSHGWAQSGKGVAATEEENTQRKSEKMETLANGRIDALIYEATRDRRVIPHIG